MTCDLSEFNDLEQRIADAAGPRHRSHTGLKLDVMRAVRNQQQRQRARHQFASTAGMLVAVLFVCGLSLRWSVSAPAASVDPPLFVQVSEQMAVEGEHIGAWGHVEAVLEHQSRVAGTLGAM